jgi:hypothetical protein
MPLRLRDNVNWCDCGGRAVFLDLEADRYFCLPKSTNDAFLRAADGQMEPGDSDGLEAMIARGVLIETSADSIIQRPPSIERPTCDYLAASTGRVGLLDLLKALAAEMRAVRSLRRKPLQQVIAAAARRGHQMVNAPGNTDRSLRTIVAASSAISLVTRTHNRCLARALAVHSTCKKRGIGPKLVFGVIGHPFAAHCWVQLGSAVLVGEFEHARLYSPILVIE